MLPDMVNPQEHLHIEETSSPLSAQIFELCDPDLFPEALQSSEINTSSNCCYEDNSFYTTNHSFAPDMDNFHITSDKISTKNTLGSTTITATATTSANSTPTGASTTTSLSALFCAQEEIENDVSPTVEISQSTSFSIPQFLPNQQDQFDLSSLQSGAQLEESIAVNDGFSPYPPNSIPSVVEPMVLPSVFEEDCLNLMPPYTNLNSSSTTSCSFLEASSGMRPYLATNLGPAIAADDSGIFNGRIIMGSELKNQKLEFQEQNGGIFCPEPLPAVYNSSNLQALNSEKQHVTNGGGSSTPLVPDIAVLEDSSFKVGKLSVEERKEKIHRYMKKRKERNFSKKIKYACRKTLADSRPRVRGRFARNDEFCDIPRVTCGNHEEDTDEDMVVKEEGDIVDSSDFFAHLTGVSSFKCNYPIQSWI
ncbi:hypothetical protein NMG60_11017541 [Bertholletia excelsa]